MSGAIGQDYNFEGWDMATRHVILTRGVDKKIREVSDAVNTHLDTKRVLKKNIHALDTYVACQLYNTLFNTGHRNIFGYFHMGC